MSLNYHGKTVLFSRFHNGVADAPGNGGRTELHVPALL